jgi:hypothetical protein
MTTDAEKLLEDLKQEAIKMDAWFKDDTKRDQSQRQSKSDRHFVVKHFQEWLNLSQNNGARYFNHRSSTRTIGS